MRAEDARDNLILFDWFSFTTTKFSVDELISFTGLSNCDFVTSLKGARGYRRKYYFDGINIHFDGREDMGVWFEMSGQGCRVFEENSSLSWSQLFTFVLQHGCHITRLDVAYDDHTGVLPLDDIVSDIMADHYVSKKAGVMIDLDIKDHIRNGYTVSVGKAMDFMIRIYDKAKERGIQDPDAHWVRCEFQLRDDKALTFLQAVGPQLDQEPIGEVFAGVLNNYFRLVSPSNDSNRWRWSMIPYWENFVRDAQRVSLYTKLETEYNAARACAFVFNQAGNAIDAIVKGIGRDAFFQQLSNRKVANNPKYSAVTAELKAIELERAKAAINLAAEREYRRIADNELDM